ncbi:MAG: DinB family protein [Acidimicrobiales bacterium]
MTAAGLIPVDDVVRFCCRTIDGMVRAVGRLDDTAVNAVPSQLPGVNSPYALVTHALGALEWWTGHMVCGHPSTRERDAEFRAAGSVPELLAAAEAAKERLQAIAPELAAATTIAGTPRTTIPLAGDWTVGACLIHAYEELAQHLGHLEITVDLIAHDPPA